MAAKRLGLWRGLTALTLFIALVAGGAYGLDRLHDPNTLPIRKVRVEGEFRKLSAPQLHAAIGDTATGGFFTVDVEQIRQAVRGLAWVQAVSVRRHWPDTLVVRVREQQAYARWGGNALVNAAGEIFRPERASFPENLPQLGGPEGSSVTVVERYRHMNAVLMPIERKVAAVRLDERRAWSLKLDNGIEVVLGRVDDTARLKRFTRVYPTAIAPYVEAVERVDLRYTNGFAVALKKENEAQTG